VNSQRIDRAERRQGVAAERVVLSHYYHIAASNAAGDTAGGWLLEPRLSSRGPNPRQLKSDQRGSIEDRTHYHPVLSPAAKLHPPKCGASIWCRSSSPARAQPGVLHADLCSLASRFPLLIGATAPSSAPSAISVSPGYAIVRHIKAPGADVWDYAAVDPETRRLYLAQSGVLALDLDTGQSVRLAQAPMIHGVVPIGRGRLAIADSTAHEVVVLTSATGRELARIPTGKSPNKTGWHNPDALVLEPTSGLLAAVNGDSGAVLLIDLERAAVVSTIRVGGKLEFAVADGKGRLFVNIESENALAVLDVARRKTVKRFPLKGCEAPSGLAYDSQDNLLLPVCDNGVVPVIDAERGHQVANVKVGKGADAIVYDAARRVAFVPAGDDGTLTVIAVRGASDIAVVQTLPTKRGVRLGALDSKTGALYLPSAEFDGAPVRLPGLRPFPGVTPGTFEFLVVARE